jgi:hypothetical protein
VAKEIVKTFYGWRLVAAGGALRFLQGLLPNQSFGAQGLIAIFAGRAQLEHGVSLRSRVS